MAIPEEIVDDILSRMPSKSLSRFKCVSKQWNRLISDICFSRFRPRRMILLSSQPFHAINSTEPASEDDMPLYTLVKLPSPFGNQKGKDVTIVGTFNGIVLLVLHDHFRPADMMLYNPFTGAFKMVPDPPLRSSANSYYACGFGHGTTPAALKIVRLRIDSCDSRSCDIFSLKKQSWKTSSRKLIGRYSFMQFAGTFLDGVLYWIAYLQCKIVIVTLDLQREVFSEIYYPCINPPSGPLFTVSGCLGFSCIYGGSFEFWVLTSLGEYYCGKLWRISCSSSSLLQANGYHHIFTPMCNLGEGTILMTNKQKKLVIFDMRKNSFKEVNVLEDVSRIGLIEYVESLVSPSDLCLSLI